MSLWTTEQAERLLGESERILDYTGQADPSPMVLWEAIRRLQSAFTVLCISVHEDETAAALAAPAGAQPRGPAEGITP